MKRNVLWFLLCIGLFVLSACDAQSEQTTVEAPKTEVADGTEPVEMPDSADITESPASENTETKVGFETAGIDELETALGDENALIVDTRVSDAYMGWAVEGAERGGHIPGATDFSYRWLDSPYSDTENLEGETREQVLEQAIDAKGLSGKKLFLYDVNGEDAQKVAQYLYGKGLEDIVLVDASEYINGDYELESYPQYELLLSPTVVKEYIDSGSADTLEEGKEYKIFNVAWGEVDQSGYLDGHVPGAVHVNTDWFEPEEIGWMLGDDNLLRDLVLRLGITADTGVIVTGPEPMASNRFATILDYLGVQDIRVMNGALLGWEGYGYELATEETKPEAVEDFGADLPANPDRIDTQDETAEYLESRENYVLVDNRTQEEFDGQSTGYSYHDKAGRIEGAVFGFAGKQSSSSMSYYRNIDKTMRNGYEIVAMLEGQGINLTDHMSFMCGSGWRAAEVLWDMRVMGYENVSLYSDGWIGWSNEGRPSIEQ